MVKSQLQLHLQLHIQYKFVFILILYSLTFINTQSKEFKNSSTSNSNATYIINADSDSESKMGNAIISDGYTSIENVPFEVYNKYYTKEAIIKFDITSKICYLSNFNRLEHIMNKFGDYYNNRWVSNTINI
jgi:hypothetical protein